MMRVSLIGDKWAGRMVFVVVLAVILASLGLPAARPVYGHTFVVNDTGNTGESEVDDGECDYSPAPGLQCTLRAAIEEANSNEVADTINFNITSTNKTISPTSRLPAITRQLTIDGYSQPGAEENMLANGTNANLKIELDGTNAGPGAEALRIRASDCVIKGLVINRFRGNSVSIGYPGEETRGNRVRGNFIGTDRSGTDALANEGRGVVLISDPGTSGNTIGGSRPAARNLISGNELGGVGIFGAKDNAILGNLIGTTRNGTDDLGNSGAGVHMQGGQGGAVGNIVGGTLPDTANTIAFNGSDGVEINTSTSIGNGVLRNSIFSNGGLGIDLGDDGTTTNDTDDGDDGPNNLQNKPNLTFAENAGGETTIKGHLNSLENRTFRIRFFSNPSGNEGKKYIGARNVSTDKDGDTGTFTFEPGNKVPAGQAITATATRRTSPTDTSEFSGPEEVE